MSWHGWQKIEKKTTTEKKISWCDFAWSVTAINIQKLRFYANFPRSSTSNGNGNGSAICLIWRYVNNNDDDSFSSLSSIISRHYNLRSMPMNGGGVTTWKEFGCLVDSVWSGSWCCKTWLGFFLWCCVPPLIACRLYCCTQQ